MWVRRRPPSRGMTMWARRRLPCGVRRRPPSFPCRREPIAGSPPWIPAVAGMTMWVRRRLPCGVRRRPPSRGMTMWVRRRPPCGVRRRPPSFPCRREPIAGSPPHVDSRRRGNNDVGACRPTVWGAPSHTVAGMTMWVRCRPPCGVRRRPPSFPCRREPIAGSPPHVDSRRRGNDDVRRAAAPYRVGCAAAYRRSRVDGNPSQAHPALDSRRRRPLHDRHSGLEPESRNRESRLDDTAWPRDVAALGELRNVSESGNPTSARPLAP